MENENRRIQNSELLAAVHVCVQIMHNDVFVGARIAHGVIRRNLGNGVSTRGSYFQLYNCTLENNTAAGFEYNPAYTSYEALQVMPSYVVCSSSCLSVLADRVFELQRHSSGTVYLENCTLQPSVVDSSELG